MTTDRAENEKRNMRITAVWWGMLFASAMCLMLVTAGSKTIVIADGSYEQGSSEGETGERTLSFVSTNEGTGVFLIPLEKDTKAENVVVGNRYGKREMHIFIKKSKAEFYEENALRGDVGHILRAGSEQLRDGVLLKLRMDDIYEYRTSMDGENLRVEICDPHEIYDLLVVVDTLEDFRSEDGRQEDDPVAGVLEALPGQVNSEKIRLYFVSGTEDSLTREEKLAFLEDAEADLYLALGVAGSEDPSVYGICGWYNDDYFIPGFGNVEFADVLTRKVTIAASDRAIGLKSAPKDSILQDISIPAAGIELGYLTNEQESLLLSQNGYREKLARGIGEALREVYTDHYAQ